MRHLRKETAMLPAAITSIKRTTVAAITALSLVTIPAAPALAWGEREQDFLKGVAAAVVVGSIIKESRRHRYVQPAPAPQPVYTPPHQPNYGSIYNSAAARAFQSYSKTERRAIQRSLARYGYYRGGLDGSFGPGTYRAVVAYARDSNAVRNLETTGGAYALYDGLIY
jgi:hypothetical protein